MAATEHTAATRAVTTLRPVPPITDPVTVPMARLRSTRPGGETQEREGPGTSDTSGEKDATPGDRVNEPIPELTAEEKAAHWGHLEEVEKRSPEEFDHLRHDPDHKNQINDKSMDETQVGLDLRESGCLPKDIRRPELANKGEFYSETTGEYYDIKGVHSDYPPFNNVRYKSQPFKGAFDPTNNEAWVSKQLAKQIKKTWTYSNY
ncbi:hypothetical protein ACFCV8_26225 [Streptomyces sp. NPDC056347]|uniref:hypothetical protein n=1 Tax=Streptomyces sp. NPDC056347 TaxID=3345790 RepID=UPI0035DBA643